MIEDKSNVANGDHCTVIAGRHKGKSGIVEDRNVAKSGYVTITVRQENGERFKTLAKSVAVDSAD